MSPHLVDPDLVININGRLTHVLERKGLAWPSMAEDQRAPASGAHLLRKAWWVARTAIARALQGGAK